MAKWNMKCIISFKFFATLQSFWNFVKNIGREVMKGFQEWQCKLIDIYDDVFSKAVTFQAHGTEVTGSMYS